MSDDTDRIRRWAADDIRHETRMQEIREMDIEEWAREELLKGSRYRVKVGSDGGIDDDTIRRVRHRLWAKRLRGKVAVGSTWDSGDDSPPDDSGRLSDIDSLFEVQRRYREHIREQGVDGATLYVDGEPAGEVASVELSIESPDGGQYERPERGPLGKAYERLRQAVGDVLD